MSFTVAYAVSEDFSHPPERPVALDFFEALSRGQAALNGEPSLCVAKEREVESAEASHGHPGALDDRPPVLVGPEE